MFLNDSFNYCLGRPTYLDFKQMRNEKQCKLIFFIAADLASISRHAKTLVTSSTLSLLVYRSLLSGEIHNVEVLGMIQRTGRLSLEIGKLSVNVV